MQSKIVTLNEVLEESEQLNLDDREYLLNLLSKRLTDLKRQRLSDRVKESIKEYKIGNVKSGNLENLWNDLND